MKAINLNNIGSEPAPESWSEIPEISAAKPRLRGHYVSLQKLHGLNICIWMISSVGGIWEPVGDFFKVSKK